METLSISRPIQDQQTISAPKTINFTTLQFTDEEKNLLKHGTKMFISHKFNALGEFVNSHIF